MSRRPVGSGLKFRPLRPGGRIALVAPASSFDREEFESGVRELRRLGFEPVYDESVFDRHRFTAGLPAVRAAALMRAFDQMEADAVMAVRGGYGSVELLPLLDGERLRRARTAFIGYSDVTSLHSWINGALGLTSVHGPMIEGRLASGPSAYDAVSFLRCLSVEPLGELTADGLEVVRAGEARGVFAGGTLTQLLASFETPFAFAPPDGHVLFVDEVGERPYRLHRMLTQWRLTGRMARAAALVFGQLPRCDEPAGGVTALDVVREVTEGFMGPVLWGFPSGHTRTPLLSVPLGVAVQVIAEPARPRLVFDEAAAAAHVGGAS